ncbi:MAG TPA: hypothetical protein VFY29_09810, partial [Terriglobia bacterium]|nr:hypothetical protein [Terriglobia bacterium]
GTQGYRGDDGPAIEAGFEFPADLAVDSKGNLYIADNLGHRVRMVSPDGRIRTVAGTGEAGFSGDGGPATAAKLQSPVRVAVDAAGNLYIADGGNARIRKVASTGVISTVAGVGRAGFSGDGGPAVSAQIGLVVGLGVDAAGNIYIADADSARVRKIAANGGAITTIAGKGGVGSNGDGGPARSAQIQLFNLAVDGPGNVFIVEANRIRKIGADGVIRLFAGSVTSGFSGDGGPATSAELRAPASVALDGKGNLFIADTLNGRVRKVTADGTIASVAGSATPPPPMVATLQQPQGARGNRATAGGNVQAARGLIGNNVNAANVVSPSALPSAAPNGRPTLLETRLAMIPHAPLTTVKDCGHVPKEAAAAAVACVEQSLRVKTPFVASFEQKGIDSTVVIGLGGTAPDSVVQVLFDSNPGGGTAGRVSAPRDCADPKITVAGASVQVTCK